LRQHLPLGLAFPEPPRDIRLGLFVQELVAFQCDGKRLGRPVGQAKQPSPALREFGKSLNGAFDRPP
jgi:hypothetical protein